MNAITITKYRKLICFEILFNIFNIYGVITKAIP